MTRFNYKTSRDADTYKCVIMIDIGIRLAFSEKLPSVPDQLYPHNTIRHWENTIRAGSWRYVNSGSPKLEILRP